MTKKFKRLVFGGVVLFIVLGIVLWFFLGQHQALKKDNKSISPFIEHEQQSSQRLLKIALLTDSHNSWESLKQAVDQVNQNNFDFVISLGDLTNLGSPEELQKGKAILELLKIPFYIIPGNHDVWYAKRYDKAHDFYFDQVFTNNFPFCFQKDGFNFILIDNADEKRGLDQIDWQNMDVCLQKDLPAFVFLHEPVYHPVNERLMGQYSEAVATQAGQLRQLFCDKKAKLIVSGHLHSFSKYFYDCENDYKLPMMVVGALATERNFQSPNFLQLTIFENGKFEEKEIVLED